MIAGKYIAIYLRSFLFILICFLWFIPGFVQAQQTILPDQLPECPVKRVMDATLTSNDVLWVVGEQSGVYSLNLKEPSAKWTHISAGGVFEPSTNYYSIIEDKQGRIWIGTDNQGVLVSDGKAWKSYTVDNVLLANRVYYLAVSPFTGEVAIATSSGVSLFNPKDQSWKDFTRANGLLEDQVRSLAFTKDGAIWFAYACGGLTKAEASHPPTSWKYVQAPWKWDEKGFVRQPPTPSGTGLPSNLNNAIIASQGTVWVATCAGVAYASVKGGTWKYVRGADWIEKNEGSYNPDKTGKWSETQPRNLLPQDHISTLAPAKQGGLWVGTRDKGICRWSPQGGVLEKIKLQDKLDSYEITTFVTFPDGSLGYGSNGQGFGIVRKGSGTWKSRMGVQIIAEPPAPPALRGEQQTSNLLEQAAKEPSAPCDAIYVGEDWMTKGDWPGRYGNVYALLCSASSGGMDGRFSTKFVVGNRKKYLTDDMYMFLKEYRVKGFSGIQNFNKKGYERVLEDDDSSNRNALISPSDFKRKTSFWDDGGTNYRYTCDGPDLWVKIIAPEGNHKFDLYFDNTSSDLESNSLKPDYYIEMRKENLTSDEKQPNNETSGQYMERLYSLPVSARARSRQFSGSGVYQQFAAKGKGTYWFRISRNNAPSAQLNGIFVSKSIEPQVFDPEILRESNSNFTKALPLPPKLGKPVDKNQQEFFEQWNRASKGKFLSPSSQSALRTGLLYQYRKLGKSEESKALRERLASDVGIVTEENRLEFDHFVKEEKRIKTEQDHRLREKLGILPSDEND